MIVLVPSSYALAQGIFPAALLSQYKPATSGGGGAVGTNYWPISFFGAATGGSGNYTVGTQIVIGSTNITITALGAVWSSESTQVLQVGIYNSGGTLLASNSITGTNASANVIMYAPITPVTLTSGATYTLASYCVGGGLFGQFPPSSFTTNGCATIANCTYVPSSVLTWPTMLNGASLSYGQAFIYQ